MKLYLLTIHHIHNFGSVFQAIALFQYIQSLDKDIEVIDYRPAYYERSNNAIKTYIGKLLNFKCYISRKNKFNKFIRNNERLTKRTYKSEKELMDFWKSEDVFIAGGDQLWNTYHPGGRDDAYKLTFTNSKYKAAFGTSMGRNSFAKEELIELAKKIDDFSMVGLREASTVNLLKKYTNVPIYHFADPVMLFDNNWYISKYIVKQRTFKEKYAVVYLTPKSDLLDATVKILQNEGYKIVHICGFVRKCNCDYMLKDSGPDEILNIIYHADFVLSASFHATVFSILFHKQFATLLPNINTNTRIDDLLSYCNLNDRIITKEIQLNKLFSPIDFLQSEVKIAELSEFTKMKIKDFLYRIEKEKD